MLTVAQAAKRLGVHPATVRCYANKGLLPAQRDWRNYRVFDPVDVERLKRERARLASDGTTMLPKQG